MKIDSLDCAHPIVNSIQSVYVVIGFKFVSNRRSRASPPTEARKLGRESCVQKARGKCMPTKWRRHRGFLGCSAAGHSFAQK